MSQFGTKFFSVKNHNHFGPSWSEVAEQLPDKLSESEISANSSGIKNGFCSTWAEVKSDNSHFQLCANWHEVTSRQLGERCSWYFTCSQIGNKSARRIFQNHLYPSWAQVQKEDFSLWTNWPQVAQRNHSQVGNNLELYFALSQIGKQCKPVQVHSFSPNHLRMLFRKLLVGATSPIPFEHHLAMMAARSF